MSQNLIISVIICTYNRAEILRIALETICNQTLDKSIYEVIVIDNNSTDNTQAVVQEFEHHGNVRHVLETVQGLSVARNRGWAEAKGDYVGYTDDDCKLPEQWLTIAHNIIQNQVPHAFGGPYYAFYLNEKPYWFKDQYGSNVVTEESSWLSKGQYLSGGNMFFRRDLIQLLGGFDPTIGMSKEQRQYGDEMGLQVSIYDTLPDHKIYYDLDLFVYHAVKSLYMNLKSLTFDYFNRGRSTYNSFSSDEARSKSFLKFMLPKLVLVFGYILQLLYHLSFGLLFRNRKQYPYYQNYYYEKTLKSIIQLGILYEAIASYRKNAKLLS